MRITSANRSDRGYEKAAQIDPYFAVISLPQFRRSELSEERLEEFFATGEQHIRNVWRSIGKFEPDFHPRRALDYGCGTGRLVIPLARVADHVVGVDISETMLAETRKNCQRLGVRNVDLVKADDELRGLTGTFDLIHSTIVFQHIPAKRVEKIARRLVGRLEPGGFGFLHFLFWSPPKKKAIRFLKRALPLGNLIANRLKGRPRDFGFIDLHPLSMDSIARLLFESGVREMFVEFSDWKPEIDDRCVNVTFRAPAHRDC